MHIFYKNKFNFIGGFREYGDYISVKNRSYPEFSKRLFVWFIDLPLYLLYSMGLRKSKVSIDQRNLHKMVIQFWSKSDKLDSQSGCNAKYENFYIGLENKSKHFGFVYNGYLKNLKKP